MFGLEGGKAEGPSFNEVAAVVLREETLIRILQPNFEKGIKRISNDCGNFTLNFDEREDINAVVLGEEDMVRIFRKYYGRAVIEVFPWEEGHGQYLIRFEE